VPVARPSRRPVRCARASACRSSVCAACA